MHILYTHSTALDAAAQRVYKLIKKHEYVGAQHTYIVTVHFLRCHTSGFIYARVQSIQYLYWSQHVPNQLVRDCFFSLTLDYLWMHCASPVCILYAPTVWRMDAVLGNQIGFIKSNFLSMWNAYCTGTHYAPWFIDIYAIGRTRSLGALFMRTSIDTNVDLMSVVTYCKATSTRTSCVVLCAVGTCLTSHPTLINIQCVLHMYTLFDCPKCLARIWYLTLEHYNKINIVYLIREILVVDLS